MLAKKELDMAFPFAGMSKSGTKVTLIRLAEQIESTRFSADEFPFSCAYSSLSDAFQRGRTACASSTGSLFHSSGTCGGTEADHSAAGYRGSEADN